LSASGDHIVFAKGMLVAAPGLACPSSRRTLSPSFFQSNTARFMVDWKKCVSFRTNKCQVVIPLTITVTCEAFQISFFHGCNNPVPEKDSVKPENMT